ncbi:MAG: sialidase family protein, partial [Acidimicrobiales bacterium]
MAIPALAGLAMVVLGTGSLLVATSLPARTATAVVGGNLPIDAGATNPLDLSSNNSPHLAANPTNAANLAVVNRIDSPTYSCALHVSFDGGARWQATTVPFPAGEQLPARCYAPNVVFASNGTMYVEFVTLYGIGNSPHAVWLSTSHDGGRTLSTPVRVTGPLAFQVSLAVDPANPDHLDMAWLHATQTGELLFPNVGNPIVFSRSTNGGRTWSKPVQVNLPSRVRVVAPSVAVGAGGRLLVSYLDMGNDALDYNGGSGGMGGPPYPGPWSLVLAYSNDQGTHWGETVIDSKVVPYT